MITRVTIQQKEELLHWKTRVEKVKEYVSQNLAGDLRITTVCEKINLNQFTLRHIFKEQQKETYREYVERIRMDKAPVSYTHLTLPTNREV